MANELTPIRRVVTGNDEQGRSKVVWDGPAPSTHPAAAPGRGYTDFWIWDESPAPLNETKDPSHNGYVFPGPDMGGHFRVVHAPARAANYDPKTDKDIVAPHPPHLRDGATRVWDRGGSNAFSSHMHKTETIDYGLMLHGERELVLDDCVLVMKPGDIVVQVGAWHQWKFPKGAMMAFDMFAAKFVDGPVGLAQGNDKPITRRPQLPAGVKPQRRIVTIDREANLGVLVQDGVAPDVHTDAARPGFAAQRLWVTDSHPAKIVFESLQAPHTIEPPKRGTVCRTYTFPPDDSWKGKAGSKEVAAYFTAMGSPGASTYSAKAPHPYMQKTRTLDFCAILEGELVLVLDTQEVKVKAGDIVILRGSNHAWSNRSTKPASVAVMSHDGK